MPGPSSRSRPLSENGLHSSSLPTGTTPPEDTISTRTFWSLFLVILIAAIGLRVYDINSRPLHSDEGVNYWFIESILREGLYRYSHENYHGPLFFYLLTLLYTLVDDSELGLRALSILCGILLVTTPLGLRKLEGNRFVLIASSLLALSPSMVFHSRYAIHEMLFVLATAWFGNALYRWTITGAPAEIYRLVLALWVLVATKETFCITLFCMFFAALLTSAPWPFLRRFWTQRSDILFSLLPFLFLLTGVYTAGFRWIDGIWEMALSIPQWIDRSHSDIGHHKPAGYYLTKVILPTEPYLLAVFGLCAVVLILFLSLLANKQTWSLPIVSERARYLRFAGVWAFLSVLVYSLVSYKTPWLIINMTLPAILFAAKFMEYLRATPLLRGIVISNGLLAATVFIGFVNTLLFNYGTPTADAEPSPAGLNFSLSHFYPYGRQNPFSYVHTAPGMLALVNDVKTYAANKATLKVLVGVSGYFPLPFYFRNNLQNTAYQVISTPAEIENASQTFDIMILDHRIVWQRPEWERKYYRLSDFAESLTFFRRTTPLLETNPETPPSR